MNPKILLGLGIAAAILIGLLLFMTQKKGSLPIPSRSNITENTIFSAKEALTKGTSVKCEYTDPQGRKGIIYANAGRVRVEGYGQGEEASYSIFNGLKSYTWSPTTKKGYVFTIPEITPGVTVTPADTRADLNVAVDALEGYEQKCTNENVLGEMFEPPADVTFEDLSAMMEQTQDLQKQLQNQGITIPKY